MNGEAAPDGIDGEIYRGDNRSALLTVEPTSPGELTVHLWAHVQGVEQAGVSLPPSALRKLAADLIARADLIDPTDPAAMHVQCGRRDGSWGCRCGWIQDKPHHEHVADMVALATATPETGA